MEHKKLFKTIKSGNVKYFMFKVDSSLAECTNETEIIYDDYSKGCINKIYY